MSNGNSEEKYERIETLQTGMKDLEQRYQVLVFSIYSEGRPLSTRVD